MVIIKGTRWGSSATSSTLDAIESAGEEEEEESGEEIRKIVLGNGGVSGKIC